jgi:hypothetical protein
MEPAAYSHPYVDSVSMDDACEQITLRVEVTDLKNTQGGIEVSGVATQVGGAVATFSKVVDIDTAESETEGGNTYWFVFVTADTIPPHHFTLNEDITVFVRVAKVWVTVLGHEKPTTGVTGETVGATASWDHFKQASQLDGKSWDQWRKEHKQKEQQGQAEQQALASQAR